MNTDHNKYSTLSEAAIASNIMFFANVLAKKQSELAEVQHQLLMLHQENIRRYQETSR